MPVHLERLLGAARGVVASLPSVIVVVSNDLDAVKRRIADAGFHEPNTCLVLRGQADLQQVVRTTGRRCVGTLDCRLAVLRIPSSAPQPWLRLLVCVIDRAAESTRFILVVRCPRVVDAQVWSRGVAAVVTSGGPGGRSSTTTTTVVEKALARLRSVGTKSKKRSLDPPIRSLAYDLCGAAVQGGSVMSVLRELGRQSARRGMAWVVPIATHYAHESVRSPQNELTAVYALAVELVARAASGEET